MSFDGTFSVYQRMAAETAVYPGQGDFDGVKYAVLGLCGEAGETAEVIKKAWRDDNEARDNGETYYLGDERRDKAIKELGDVLWYAAALATELGVGLQDVARQNLVKLAERKHMNKLHGEGSDR